jgi:hypothetical protein
MSDAMALFFSASKTLLTARARRVIPLDEPGSSGYT